jgi:teichuronic acid biosynthesis glycosyltransferase TuaC
LAAEICGESGVPEVPATLSSPVVTRLQHIAVITGNYPSRVHPSRGTFVRQLVDAVAKEGVRCTVIHPWKLHEWLRERRQDFCDEGDMVEGVQLHRPLTLSLSNRRFGPFNTFALTHADFQRAVWRILRRLPEKPDAVYGHFLYSAGAAAVWAAHRLGRPGFVAVGESYDHGDQGLWSLRDVPLQVSKRRFGGATGFVAVSGLLQRQLVAELGIAETKIGVFPNGTDRGQFHPHDRNTMRRKYALPQDCFLVAFVGAFDERKGVQRVCHAMRDLSQVRGIFIGEGGLPPRGDQVAFCGPLPHKQVPELLSAADAFVLPSRAEGSSNATLEAMACGLPVVVSARPFNADVCDKDCAWMVEPDDVAAIRQAIVALQNNPELRRRLADAAFSRAARFDIQARARRILAWMEQRK